MLKICTLCVLVILLTACSTNSKDKELSNSENHSSTGATATPNSGEIPVIQEETEEESGATTSENVYRKKNKKSHINLHLGPGLYNTFSYVGLFKSLEKNRLKVKSLSGVEFGGLIAALYAKLKKSSLVEWELFKLLQHMDQDTKVYSTAWKKEITDFINTNFSRIDFNQLDIELSIPIWKDSGYEWIRDGNVAQVLLASLGLNQSLEQLEKNYKSLKIELQKNEGEIWASVDVLAQNNKLSSNDQALKHLMLALTETSRAAKKQSDLYISMKYTPSELDRSQSWQKNNPVAKVYGHELVKKLNQYVQEKVEAP